GEVDRAAFDTLFTVLETVCRVAAPLLPLTTEEVWRGLTGGRSVHLTDWPSARAPPPGRGLGGGLGQGGGGLSARPAPRPERLAAQPAAAVVDDGGGRGSGAAEGLRGDRRRRAQREVGAPARCRPPRRRVVRRLAAADRERARRRSPARQGRAGRDQGVEVR